MIWLLNGLFLTGIIWRIRPTNSNQMHDYFIGSMCGLLFLVTYLMGHPVDHGGYIIQMIVLMIFSIAAWYCYTCFKRNWGLALIGNAVLLIILGVDLSYHWMTESYFLTPPIRFLGSGIIVGLSGKIMMASQYELTLLLQTRGRFFTSIAVFWFIGTVLFFQEYIPMAIMWGCIVVSQAILCWLIFSQIRFKGVALQCGRIV